MLVHLKHNIQTPYNQIIKEILDAIYQNEIIKNSQILTKV